MTRPLRIAWFSPLNAGSEPSESVSAYVTDTLLPHLRGKVEIELFHQSFARYRDYPTYHYLSAVTRHRDRPYDLFFYQLEDARWTNFCRIHLGLEPGIVWFHDFLFTTFGPEPILNSPWEEIVRHYREAAAPWPAPGAEFEQHGPLGYREAALTAVPLFSSERHHSEYRRAIQKGITAGEAPSYYLPFPVERFGKKVRRSEGTALVALCGTPRIEHRAHKVLQAISESSELPAIRWLVGNGEEDAARALLSEFGIESAEVIAGRSPERWASVVQGADVAIHTLFSVFGQPTPYLSISLAAEVPSVVTNFGGAEYLPDRAVFKVEPGETEAHQIRTLIDRLCASPRPSFGIAGGDYARESFDARVVAEELLWIFHRSAPFIRTVRERWEAMQRAAREELMVEARRDLEGSEPDPFTKHTWERMVESTMKELGL